MLPPAPRDLVSTSISWPVDSVVFDSMATTRRGSSSSQWNFDLGSPDQLHLATFDDQPGREGNRSEGSEVSLPQRHLSSLAPDDSLHEPDPETLSIELIPWEKADDPSEVRPKFQHRARPSTLLRLGTYNIIALITPAAMTVSCLIALSSLWFSNSSDPIWLHIALQGWMTRCVTLTAMLMRWACSTQAVVATSQLAAIFLELFEVALPDAAGIPELTAENSGPLSLLYFFRSSEQATSC